MLWADTHGIRLMGKGWGRGLHFRKLNLVIKVDYWSFMWGPIYAHSIHDLNRRR